MHEIAITAENIGKRYYINPYHHRAQTLGKVLIDSLVSPFNFIHKPGKASDKTETLWALRNVSFSVNRGEVLGVLGQNGAGKSTLLRILSRITLPTEGTATIFGRVGSLLQIGTGFNSELTGRENIYLNGTILGMKKQEVDAKFDEIVDFSGVERFIDTPIKRYSSGMIVRLGFSVAISLDPDILLVDEVLSVGDAEFRKKSMEKVLGLVNEGCSVLFVSHDLFMIQRLCKRAMLLEKGQIVENTDTDVMIENYLSKITSILSPGEWMDLSTADHQGTGEAHFTRITYHGDQIENYTEAHPDGPVQFLLEIESNKERYISGIALSLFDLSGFRLINAGKIEELPLKRGRNCVSILINHLHLQPGTYLVALWMVGPAEVLQDQIQSAVYINVVTNKESAVPDLDHYHDRVTSQVEVSIVDISSI